MPAEALSRAERGGHPCSQAGANIIDATVVLARHPMIGRSVEGGLRELVISHGSSGYGALYRFIPSEDQVQVLASRHRREAGFR
jgi:plasmid stabilization system protein ParE